MQLNLFLCRHADTYNPSSDQPDFDRSLTPEGEQQAVITGNWISDQEIILHTMYCSPALRTKTTANFIINQIGYLPDQVVYDEHIYQAKASDLVNILSKTDINFKTILLVGHNPAISHLVEDLTGKDIGFLNPASALLIQFDIKSWEEILITKGNIAAEHFTI